MLRAYFDDSGTHADSEVVVVGGLVGTVVQWEEFEQKWVALLAHPLPGKPPLNMFHLSPCSAREGEFRGYSYGDQDAIIHDFRKILIDTRLISIASAIDQRAWNDLVVGSYREDLGNALGICLENCVAETMKIAGPHPEGDKVEIVIDQGMLSQRTKELAEAFTHQLGRPRVVSTVFARVEEVPPLQGADIVATESYWHGVKTLREGYGAVPRPHLQHFLKNMFAEALIVDRKQIALMLETNFDSNGWRLEAQPC